MFLKKSRLGFIGATLALVVFTAMQPAKAATDIVVQIYPGSLISLYPELGISLGFYKAEDLNAKLIPLASGPQANAALAGGSLNFVLNTGDNLILAKDRGLNVIAVVGNQIGNFYSLIGQRNLPIRKGADYKEVATGLIGKRIGINAIGTNGERFTRAILSTSGLGHGAATLIPVGAPSSALAAFSAKSIDAAFSWEPFQTVATKENGRMLLDCRVAGQCPPALEKPGTAFQVYYTIQSFLDSHPNAVAGFMRAHEKINAWAHDPKNREALIAAVKKFVPPPSGLNIDATAFATALVDKSLPIFGVTIDPKGLDAWNQQLVDAKLIKSPVDVKKILWKQAPKP